MKKFRSFFTILFLLSSLVIILFIALFDNIFFIRAMETIKINLLPAAIAAAIFLGFLSAGIVSKSTNSFGTMFKSGYFQLAILELFLFSAGLIFYRYYIQQPGHIIIRLHPEQTKDTVTLGLKFQSADSSATDTVIAPTELYNLSSGNYSFEILDRDIVYIQTDLVLQPMETETLFVPVNLEFKSVVVQTEPSDAEIWIDDSLYSTTPDTVEIFNKDTVLLALKLNNYQTYTDTLVLAENKDLGIISLLKLYSLRVSSIYDDIQYRIYNADKKVVYRGTGSRRISLAQGTYTLSYDIGEGQVKTKMIVLNYNQTIEIP